MAITSMQRLDWQLAVVREIVTETLRVKSLALHLSGWQGHLPGQHVDIRLTAEDGYQAQRSYSIASPPEDELLSLTVEKVDNGEVSPYLVEHLRVGDQFELRGPIGGYFVWTLAAPGPLWLIAGGSGIHDREIERATLSSSCIWRIRTHSVALHGRPSHLRHTRRSLPRHDLSLREAKEGVWIAAPGVPGGGDTLQI